jgi:hypothetical protein
MSASFLQTGNAWFERRLSIPVLLVIVHRVLQNPIGGTAQLNVPQQMRCPIRKIRSKNQAENVSAAADYPGRRMMKF